MAVRGFRDCVCVCKPFNKDLSYSKEIPCPFTWSLSSRISKVKGGLLTRDETVQMGWDRACRSSPSPFILNRTESFKLSIWLKGVILDTLWSQFIATFSATSQKVLSLRRRNFFSGYGNSADWEGWADLSSGTVMHKYSADPDTEVGRSPLYPKLGCSKSNSVTYG